MRQVFTSARIENVEHVARLLGDAGIEVRITHGRSYRGAIRGNFSYRDEGGQKPAVWIVRSEDQPRARAMLREAGLMDSSRNAPDSYLAMSFRGTAPERAGRSDAQRRAFRIKLGLLVVIAVMVALAFMALRPGPDAPARGQPAAAAPAPAPAPRPVTAPVPGDLPPRGNTATPDSLAVALLRGELPARAGEIACLAIDGGDPAPSLLAALPPSPGRVLPVSRCPATPAGGAAAEVVAVGRYEANAEGIGTIFLQRRRVGGKAVPQWYEVRPEGEGWRIIQPL